MNVIRTLSNMLFPLITFPYSTRILGPEGTGKIAFANSFVSYFILLASIGIPLYGNREIGKCRNDKNKLVNLVQELFVLSFSSSLISTILLILTVFSIDKIGDEKKIFLILSFSILLTSISMEWLYQGLERYSYITIRSLIFSTIGVVSIFIFINDKQDYVLYALIGLCASFGSSLLNFYKARHILCAKRSEKYNFKKHFRPLLNVFAINFIISIYLQLDTVMLGFMASPKLVGYYSIGLKINKILLAVVSSLGYVLIPRLSYFIANDNMHEFNKMIKKSFLMIWLLCLPLVFSLMLFSEEIILIIADKYFLKASICILITSPVIIAIGFSNILGLQILFPLGFEKKVIVSVTLGAIISILLNIFLIPIYGHVGAAFSTLISEFAVLSIMLFLIPDEYRGIILSPNVFNYVTCSLIIVSFLYLFKMVFQINLISLILLFPFCFVLYFGLLVLIKDDFVISIIKSDLFSTNKFLKIIS